MEVNHPHRAANGHGAGSKPDARAVADAALSRISTEFHDFVADVEDLLQASGALTGEDLSRAKVKLQARVAAARESIGDVGDAIATTSRTTVKRANDLVHNRPWQSIGISAAAGVLVGLLVARLASSRGDSVSGSDTHP
jgi:ElaB/YqjD/DUF883 family membrane-anchored ribosome-binding protein